MSGEKEPLWSTVDLQLWEACSNGDVVGFERARLAGASMEHRRSKRGDTLLHAAVQSGSLEMVQHLVMWLEMPVDQPNAKGESPLMMAFEYAFPEIVDYLVEAGANRQPVSDNGETLLFKAGRARQQLGGVMVRLALALESDPNALNADGRTALYTTVEMGSVPALEALLRAGADPKRCGKEQQLLPHDIAVADRLKDQQRVLEPYLQLPYVNYRSDQIVAVNWGEHNRHGATIMHNPVVWREQMASLLEPALADPANYPLPDMALLRERGPHGLTPMAIALYTGQDTWLQRVMAAHQASFVASDFRVGGSAEEGELTSFAKAALETGAVKRWFAPAAWEEQTAHDMLRIYTLLPSELKAEVPGFYQAYLNAQRRERTQETAGKGRG